MSSVTLFRDDYSDATANAQKNLAGRTHYVDPDTLRFHKARIVETHITDQGLLLALVESVAIDPDNQQRGFRPVIFDVFGTVLSRVSLDGCFKSRKAAVKAMWDAVNAIDAKKHTYAAIASEKRKHTEQMKWLRIKVKELK